MMAKPTQEEIDEFNRRMEEPDENEDDFEIEIFTPEGHGARLPYRKGRSYLQQHFGIDADSLPGAPGANSAPAQKGGSKAPETGSEGTEVPPEGEGTPRPSQRYFGRRQ